LPVDAAVGAQWDHRALLVHQDHRALRDKEAALVNQEIQAETETVELLDNQATEAITVTKEDQDQQVIKVEMLNVESKATQDAQALLAMPVHRAIQHKDEAIQAETAIPVHPDHPDRPDHAALLVCEVVSAVPVQEALLARTHNTVLVQDDLAKPSSRRPRLKPKLRLRLRPRQKLKPKPRPRHKLEEKYYFIQLHPMIHVLVLLALLPCIILS